MSPYPGFHVIVIISCNIALHLLDKNAAFNDELEKYRLFVRGQDRKISSCHHSAKLVMQNGDPRNRLLIHAPTQMMDSY